MMYHSKRHTIQYKSTFPPELHGTRVKVTVREDGKMPCPCGEEGHARFNWLKMARMCEMETHPLPGDKSWADIPSQVSVPDLGELQLSDPGKPPVSAQPESTPSLSDSLLPLPPVPDLGVPGVPSPVSIKETKFTSDKTSSGDAMDVDISLDPPPCDTPSMLFFFNLFIQH